jgi:hypothetical protein
MHLPAGPAWLVWLESTSLAEAMRQWLWLYPIVEIIHILGLVVLVGAVALFDFKLLGFSPSLPLQGLARDVLPWAQLSLLVIVPSGLLMFIAHATEMANNPAFQLKLLLLAAAGLNALVFHKRLFPTLAACDQGMPVPRSAKIHAVLSLSLWAGVITCGRLLAYL